jgi:hypothetical protein
MSAQPHQCFSCERELEQTFVLVPEGGNPDDYMIRQAVWVSPLGRQVGFCDRCYERQNFERLEPEEVGALHWAFGCCDAEDPPEVIKKKIRRLLRAVEDIPCGEVFAALARAYHLAGQKPEARSWAAKAVAWRSEFPGKEQAAEILRDD